MNVQEYISSGIVESYVLGLASPEEGAEFERMCFEYPEVKAARIQFEMRLEEQSLIHAVQPPAFLKHKILQQAGITAQADVASNRMSATASIGAPVISLNFRMRYIAAAAVILLLASTALNFYFFSQYRSYSQRYDQLVATQSQLASSNQNLQTKIVDYESALNMIKDPAMTVVKMPGVPSGPDPASLATVYWDGRSKNVYLLVNHLPEPNAGKQYQLWALVDGKPIDAGMVDIKEGLAFVKMKNIPKAQAFAITLEKTGGSPAPTMTALYVLGKVTG